ncbi:MAG: hypothetical protein ACTSPI_02215 [Candidatus Heimdallarchaeaceae archaeon]
MNVEKHQMLKTAALLYVESRDPAVFLRIINKVDRLLKYNIHRLIYVRPYLRSVEFQDLYQTAIIGLYYAVLKTKEEEPGSKLIYNIVRYISNEVIKKYKGRPYDKLSTTSFEQTVAQNLVDTVEVYKDLEIKFNLERIVKLTKEDVISFEELQLLCMRFSQGMTYKNMAIWAGVSRITVTKKVENAVHRLRYEFRRRGWEMI